MKRRVADGVAMMATPTTMWQQLIRRLGLDRNPLRRRSDRIAAWLAPAVIAVFLGLCPVISGWTGSWVRADNAALQRTEQSWPRVRGVLQQASPGPLEPDHGGNGWTEAEPARWTFDGKVHTGLVPVPSGLNAGTPVTVELNPAGQVQAPPLNAPQLRDRIDTMAFFAMVMIGVVLLLLAWLARRYLDKRRIAGWETEWLTVGPHWTHH
jgi:hypothetical protein